MTNTGTQKSVASEVAGGDQPPESSHSVAVLFDRHRLRVARELRGLSQVELAREVGNVRGASLSQFETGHSRPSASTLNRLATVLDVPIEFFSQSRKSADVGTAGFFRSLRSTAPKDRDRARAMVTLTHELVSRLEDVVALPDLDLPRHFLHDGDETALAVIEGVAADLRMHWQLPPGPVEDMVRVIERRGIVTTRFKTNVEKIDAFSVRYDDRPIVVLGADKAKRHRSRFDAAHELGHLVMHDAQQAGEKVIESQANWFAAAFLMPAEEIRAELPSRADWARLVELKQRWHVSIAALLVRAKVLGVMPERTYVQALKTMSARGWRKDEPGDLGIPEAPALLAAALSLAAQNGVSLERLACEAGLPLGDVRTIVGAASDSRPRVEV